MADKSINAQILKLAGPSILANITVPLVGIVDLAIAGHIGDAVTMGGLAMGTMLFDILYWNVGFLRVGTAGVTAQAYGRGDFQSAMRALVQGLATAFGVIFIIFLIQWAFVKLALMVLGCSPEVAVIAERYFSLRVWAVPAALMLMVLRGWFIGMQNTLFPMILDIFVNLANVGVSYLLAVNLKMGIDGVAIGTVIAQWSGLLLGGLLLIIGYRGYLKYLEIKQSVRWSHIRGFFKMNGNLFIRSNLMMVVYSGFLIIAGRFNDVELAVASLMMKLLLLYSYFTDGFAYSAEALVGKFIGARDEPNLKKTIHLVFVWSLAVGIVSTLVYAFAGEPMVRIFTSDAVVVTAAHRYLFWLVLLPTVSCIAFVWDGIYIGATASSAMRNSMILSALLFLASYFVFRPLISYQALYLAYFVHLLVRSIYLSAVYRKYIVISPFDRICESKN